jgi:hypothetical protein
MAQAPRRSAQGGKLAAGVLMLVAAVGLPFVGWFTAQSYVAGVAARDHVPNQNAMVLAFLGFCVSCVVAFAMFITGVVFLTMGLTARRRAI